MATTNIFMNYYQQPENRLTYNFLSLVEHMPDPERLRFIAYLLDLRDMPQATRRSVEVETLISGYASNPDGVIKVLSAGRAQYTIYLESKTYRLHLTAEQLSSHWELWCKEKASGQYVVLAITPRRSDKDVVARAQNSQIRLKTWGDIAEKLRNLYPTGSTPFIVSQFIEYGKLSREFQSMEIAKTELDAYILATAESVRKNLKWILQESIDAEFFEELGLNLKETVLADHWGRFGIECALVDGSVDQNFGQWLFFGVYESDTDHGIPFKCGREPELAFFLDMDPNGRQRLLANEALCQAVERLEAQKGFDQNLTRQLTTNGYRFLAHRTPLSNFPTNRVGIRTHFEAILRTLLEEPEVARMIRSAPSPT